MNLSETWFALSYNSSTANTIKLGPVFQRDCFSFGAMHSFHFSGVTKFQDFSRFLQQIPVHFLLFLK